MENETEQTEETYYGTATYSPEDNKLRFYPDCRLPDDIRQRLKTAGFRWAPKQELYVDPSWSPHSEDLLIELCGEIDDEDVSPEERAAQRAERFSMYRDKRRSEAMGQADRFSSGPSAFGHQNQARAQRQANRHDRYRTRAINQWDKAEYWQQRTRGVISSALHKANVKTRRGRILVIEKELRKIQGIVDKANEEHRKWKAISLMSDADCFLCDENSEAAKAAFEIVKYDTGRHRYKHPRSTDKEGSLYTLLTGDDKITVKKAAELYLELFGQDEPKFSDYDHRWFNHYKLRIAYEMQMIGEEGGLASEVDMQVGGWVGQYQIHKVNRSSVTKRVVSVSVMGEHPWLKNEDGTPKICLQTLNIERCGSSVYRPPTEEEVQAFNSKKKEKQKEQQKKNKENPKPKLINPTLEDAERLQKLLNERAEAKMREKSGRFGTFEPSPVIRGTQKSYSEASKGSYSAYEVVSILEDGTTYRARLSKYWGSDEKVRAKEVCKIRMRHARSQSWYSPYHVVVLTDKKQESLPIDWELAERKQVSLTVE